MKKILLSLFAFILFAGNVHAQAVANQAPDISQCGNEVFDLTVQTPIVLGSQNPDDFTVNYFQSETNAQVDINAIVNADGYVSNGQQQIIYVRVTNINDDSYAINSFMIMWGSGSAPNLGNVLACDSYTLPYLPAGNNYYTGPSGTGTMLVPGSIITTSQIIYILYESFGCIDEKTFSVTINNSLPTPQTLTLTSCDPDDDGIAVFDLMDIIPDVMQGAENAEIFFYETEADANNINNSGNAITDITAYTVNGQQTIYAQLVSGNCFTVSPIILIVTGECTDNIISGTVAYDIDNNGCTATDTSAAGILVSYTNNDDVYYTYTNANGEYYFYNVPDGENTVEVPTSDSTSYTASPLDYVVTSPASIADLDFCLTVSNPINDVAITIIPTTLAIPGFQASYILSYQNMGALPSSGYISFVFDDTMMTYSGSSPVMQQSGNTLTFQYTNLAPFQAGYIAVDFMVMQPPTVNDGDILAFTATIDIVIDDDWNNNSYELNQVVVNSYDPNDIAVNEGEYISEAQAERYLHYTVRFQNEGTANATNVRVDTDLDANLDWSTLEPITSSHNYVAERNGNSVSFIFNNIDLPYADANEAGSHGFISYRIKPVATIEVGDSMEATAGIYFDFNEAIITNTVTTTVQTTASNQEFMANTFVVYPNPASSNVTLKMQNLNGDAMVSVTDVLGKTVLSTRTSSNELNLDISMLKSGIYFITLEAAEKSITKKVVIK